MAAKANKKSSRRARKSVGRRIMSLVGLGSKSRSSARRSRTRKTRKTGKRGYTVVRSLRGVKVEGYCRNCGGKRQIASPALVKMNANGGAAVLGKCPDCGRGMFRFGAPEAPASGINARARQAPRRDVKAPVVAKASTNGKSSARRSAKAPAEQAPVPALDSILRSPKGNVRNFRSMSDGKLLTTLDQVLAGGLNEQDPEGYAALVRVMDARGDSRADDQPVVKKSARRSVKVPDGVKPVPDGPFSTRDSRLRGKSGQLRNFTQMGDDKLNYLVKATVGTGDSKARKALLAVARERRAAAKAKAAA